MTRLRWIPAVLLALAVASPAAQKKPDDKKQDAKKQDNKKKAKPKAPTKPENATWLDKNKGSWYVLYTPEGYTTKEKYPLVVLTKSSRHGGAQQDIKNWMPVAKSDRIFLAALELPRDYQGDKTSALTDMVVKILKETPTIDRRCVMLLGAGSGANEVLSIVASRPRLFAAAIALSPDKYPDMKKIQAEGPALSRSYTPIYLTVDPKSKDAVDAFKDAHREFARKRLRLIPQKAEGVGGGKASEDELKFTRKVLESKYPSSKRAQILAARREAERKEREREAAEAAKVAAAQKTEPKASGDTAPAEPEKKPEKRMDPDDLLEVAREHDADRRFAEAYKAYARLAKENPDSDYSRVAEARIKELKADPRLAKAIADAEVGTEARSLLARARNFANAKMNDKAIPEFQKIIAKFPGTSYAEQAQRELDNLQGNE
jgi:hypothetical protein